MRILNLISGSGYYIGLGIEAAVALVAGVLLVLLLANVFVKSEEDEVEEPKQSSALVPVEGAAASDGKGKEKGKKKNRKADEPDVVEAVPVVLEQQAPADPAQQQQQQQPIIINVYNNGAQEGEKVEVKTEQPAPETPEEPEEPAPKEKDSEVKFSESKTIEELYAELTDEQKQFFDELKKKALAKPKAVLSVTRNYESVKVGKHSILKLLIRKGVTIAEFLLESDALKEYRKNSENKKGKSKIRIRPTVIAVTDLDSLKTALDMIDLAHEQLFDE